MKKVVLSKQMKSEKGFMILKKESILWRFIMKVKISVIDFGDMIVELDEKSAPKTVENFLNLVDDKFYDGLTFHRVIPGFMIQGGCPIGNGTGGPGYQIVGEFASNGIDNPLRHTKGVISMARAMDPNSAGSQFFLMHENSPHLDGDYAAFGKIVEGLHIVDEIAKVETDYMDKPVEKVVIETIRRVDLSGVS